MYILRFEDWGESLTSCEKHVSSICPGFLNYSVCVCVYVCDDAFHRAELNFRFENVLFFIMSFLSKASTMPEFKTLIQYSKPLLIPHQMEKTKVVGPHERIVLSFFINCICRTIICRKKNPRTHTNTFIRLTLSWKPHCRSGFFS